MRYIYQQQLIYQMDLAISFTILELIFITYFM